MKRKLIKKESNPGRLLSSKIVHSNIYIVCPLFIYIYLFTYQIFTTSTNTTDPSGTLIISVDSQEVEVIVVFHHHQRLAQCCAFLACCVPIRCPCKACVEVATASNVIISRAFLEITSSQHADIYENR